MEVRMLDRTRHTADPLPSASDAAFALQPAKRMTTSAPHFLQLVGMLRRRSRLILIITMFGAILAGITGLLIKPKYTATAQIVVEPPAAALLSPETVQQVIDTHVTMLTSASHAQRV